MVLRGTIVDVCLDGRTCLTERCPEPAGDGLSFWALDTGVVFSGIEIRTIDQGA